MPSHADGSDRGTHAPGGEIAKLDAEQDPQRFSDLSRVLFDQAALAAGDGIKDPAAYVKRLNKLLLELAG